jgi:hypothetical protein
MVSVLVAALLVAASPGDTVYTVDGGRIAGTVLEESATSGVVIQTPDGSVRRIERGQVSRIEFADGTVSPPRPAAPPPQAAPAPKAPEAEGGIDTVHFKGGGRVRGTVIEESAASGAKVRLLDGTVRGYPTDEVARIEYADGTVSTPQQAPAKAPEPGAPRAKPAEAPVDNVYFLAGGRVRGTVIEENPKTGVKVRLLDGTVQVYSRDDLVRIEYADGSVSRRVTPAAPAAAPQPAAATPPKPPEERSQLIPIYLTLGVGATFLGGDAAVGVPMSSVLVAQQAHVSGEVGLRLTPPFAIGVYGDVGGGDPSRAIRDQCAAQGNECVAATGRAGVLVRYTWDPLSRRPVWLSLGTGWEFGGVTIDHRGTSNGNGSNRADLLVYSGREYVRLGAGVDFRSNSVLAFGLYGSVAFGEYDKLKDLVTTVSVDRATHVTAQLGVRLTLFP